MFLSPALLVAGYMYIVEDVVFILSEPCCVVVVVDITVFILSIPEPSPAGCW